MATEMMRGNEGLQICYGPISRLPKEVVFEILVRISSVKTIALCKSVCKSWSSLISDPRFAKLHLVRSKICVLVRKMDEQTTLKTVHLLEDEDGRRGFHSSHCICDTRTETESCEICRSDATAITKLKIPVVQVGPLWGKTISNTCEGLVCLYRHNYGYAEDSPFVVCNPMTGEFIYLPHSDRHNMSVCGFGLDLKTGQYKVVKLYSLVISNSEELAALKVVVHVLGTDSWRELDTSDIMLDLYSICVGGPTLLDGTLHWVYMGVQTGTYGIVSFDLESEQLRYRSLPSLPPRDLEDGAVHDAELKVVVLGGRLCVCRSNLFGKLHMCSLVDERSSVSDSLPEWISHDLSEVRGYLQLICSLDDGALLMYNGFPAYQLIYYDPSRGSLRFKRMKFADRNVKLEVVAYTPSFLSIEDILRPGNAEVLNVYSRNGKLDEDAHFK